MGESLVQCDVGQDPREHISQLFLHECSPNHTRWESFINVKLAVIIRNFLIGGFGADISATSESDSESYPFQVMPLIKRGILQMGGQQSTSGVVEMLYTSGEILYHL